MAEYIVKPSRDEDFYVSWSTEVDAPTACGPRVWLSQHLGGKAGAAERFDRADLHGSSCRVRSEETGHSWYGWGDDDFLVMEVEIANRRFDGAYRCPRSNLRAMCERMLADEDADVSDLLVFEAYEDETAGGS